MFEDWRAITQAMNEFGYAESKKSPGLFYKKYHLCLVGFFEFRENRSYHSFFVKFLDYSGPNIETIKQIVLNDFFNISRKLKIYFDFNQRTNCSRCNKYTICKGISIPGINGSYFLNFCCQSCEDKKDDIIKKYDKEEIRESEEARIWEINNAIELREKLICQICKKKLDLEFNVYGYPELKGISRDEHHVDYNQDKTILICKSCHIKVTLYPEKYPELKKYQPIGTRKEYLNKKIANYKQ